MTHKKFAALRFVAIVGLVTLTSVGCSGQQQGEEDNFEVTDDEEGAYNQQASNQQGDLGNDDAAQNNGQENYVDGDNSGYEAQNGAETNSDVVDDASASNYMGTPNNTLENPSAMTANYSGDGANQAITNQAIANQTNQAYAPTETAAMPAAAPSDSAPISGGRVRYVPAGGVQVVSGPGGSVVTSLQQGDHPVTWEENGYLKISNGMYVPVGALSDAGVPRAFPGPTWQGGN
jgi:hypothetical protein